MHIVFLTHEYPQINIPHGGIGSFVQNLGTGLVEKGYKVSVVGIGSNPNNNAIEIDKGVEIYRIKPSKIKYGKFIFNSRNIRKTLKIIHSKNPIDIVEGSELSFAFIPKKTPYIKLIRLHGGHHFFSNELGKKINWWKAKQERISFLKANHFVAVSDYVGEKTQQYLNLNFNFTKIYNSVSIDKFNKTKSLVVKNKTLLFVGTVCEKKGIRQLVLAMPAIIEKYPNVQLKIVGRDWSFSDGSSYIKFLKISITKNIEKNITFLGQVPHTHIPAIIQEAEICIYPSHMESFGLTLVEAMAMEKPIIASNIPPFLEIVEDHKTALICNPFSSEDISKKVIEMLSNPKKAIEMSKKARLDVVKNFNSKMILEQNSAFYKSLINN